MRLSDNDAMPFGKHKHVPMKDVPAGWLKWFYEEKEGLTMHNMRPDEIDVLDYIEERLETIEQEAEQEEKDER